MLLVQTNITQKMCECINIGSMNRLVARSNCSMSMVFKSLLIIQNEGAVPQCVRFSTDFSNTIISGDEPSCRAFLCIPNALR